jgi:hypothetical protein
MTIITKMNIDSDPMDDLTEQMSEIQTYDSEDNWEILNDAIMKGRELIYTEFRNFNRMDNYLTETSNRYNTILRHYRFSEDKETNHFCRRIEMFFMTPSRVNKISIAYSLDMSLFEYIYTRNSV